ncbi:hypothetical protein PVT71_12310 [Salipiger sp. H15]|uniref:Uncharacterized protein n=1 Tax=Alloyangia sp. H15 TaxID=3029062 RepID=A0AAU8AEJ0_9RHOB
MNFHKSPLFIATVAAIAGAVPTVLVTMWAQGFWDRPDKSLSAEYCAGEPMVAYMIDAEGTAWNISDQMESNPITHVLTITNDGKEVLTDQDINLSFSPRIWDEQLRSGQPLDGTKFELLELTVFLESALAQHVIDFDLDRPAQRITLKDFNPGDTISVLVESPYQLDAGVSAKGPGLTVSETFTSGCTTDGYGGYAVYRDFSPRCAPVPFPDLGLSCTYNMEIKMPEGSAKAARFEWRRH